MLDIACCFDGKNMTKLEDVDHFSPHPFRFVGEKCVPIWASWAHCANKGSLTEMNSFIGFAWICLQIVLNMVHFMPAGRLGPEYLKMLRTFCEKGQPENNSKRICLDPMSRLSNPLMYFVKCITTGPEEIFEEKSPVWQLAK